MPNWCENYLVVSGPKESVEKFKLQAQGKNAERKIFDFDCLLPKPPEVESAPYDPIGYEGSANFSVSDRI